MAWPSTETVVFAGLVMIPAASQVLQLLYVAIKGRPSEQELHRAGNSPWIGYGLTTVTLVGLVAVLAYFWFFDPASHTFRDWLSARETPALP
jgi:hypothetical protein